MHPVKGLQVHGLPKGAAFGIIPGQGLQNFRGAGSARLRGIQGLRIRTYLGAHGLLLKEQAAEPEIGLGILSVIGVHGYGQILKAFFIAHINSPFLGNMFFQIGQLAANHPGNDITHAVVVAQLLMLIPGRIFPALGGPFPGLVRFGPGMGQQHPSGRTGDDLVSVEADNADISQQPGLAALIAGAQGFRRIFNDNGSVAVCNGNELVQFSGGAVQVGQHHRLYSGINGKSLFQRFRVHVPGIPFRIDKYLPGTLIHNRIGSGGKGHVAGKNQIPRFDTAQFHGQMQSCRSGGQGYGIAAQLLCDLFLHPVNVFPYGRHPVGVEGFFHINQLFSMHGGGGEVQFLCKRLHIIRCNKHSTASFTEFCLKAGKVSLHSSWNCALCV